jgi:hypothetical protein
VTYRGKVDWWVGLAILAGIFLPLGAAIRLHSYRELFFPVALIVFLLTCCYPQTYQTADDALIIHSGLMKRVIPWPGITSVRPSSDSRSSLAMSLDRVLVEHAGGEILIAPDNQARFLEDVAAHCPQLSRRGMDLVIALN